MAFLPIIVAPDPRLKQKSAPVETITPEILRLIDDMFDTMYEAGGIGLAAVQVGVHLRILVVDVEQREEDGRVKPLVFINPEILSDSEEENIYREGCLSFPGQYSEVTRPQSIRLRYLTREGKSEEIEATGLLATCLQHEIDHLNGVVFVDHLSSVKRDIILRRLKKLKREHAHDHAHDHVHDEHCNH